MNAIPSSVQGAAYDKIYNPLKKQKDDILMFDNPFKPSLEEVFADPELLFFEGPANCSVLPVLALGLSS
jgi:hypothetical protein